MNQPPSRHPLFIAIACIALAGAWSTGAYEAETGTSVALMTQEALPMQRSADACVELRGPSRALCVFEATRPPPLRATAMQEAPAAVRGLRMATHRDAPARDLP